MSNDTDGKKKNRKIRSMKLPELLQRLEKFKDHKFSKYYQHMEQRADLLKAEYIKAAQ